MSTVSRACCLAFLVASCAGKPSNLLDAGAVIWLDDATFDDEVAEALARSCLVFDATSVVVRAPVGGAGRAALSVSNRCGHDVLVRGGSLADARGAIVMQDLPPAFPAGAAVDLRFDFDAANGPTFQAADLVLRTTDPELAAVGVTVYALAGGDALRTAGAVQADAGPAYLNRVVGQEVSIDGTASSPDAPDASYLWRFRPGRTPAGSAFPAAGLQDATSEITRFTPDVAGVYGLRLAVATGGTVSVDAVEVAAATGTANQAPRAVIGNPSPAVAGTEVPLVSHSSDPDGTPDGTDLDHAGDDLTHVWRLIERPPGSTATIDDPSAATTAFTPDLAGTYRVRLRVQDGLAEHRDSLTIEVLPAPPDTGSPTTDLRFVVLGDAGTGEPEQFAVAAAMEQVCALQRCDFALYLGDNFYPTGVTSAADAQFQDKFESPYANLDFPFYVVLGNHDYATGLDTMAASYQVEYAALSTKWVMPDLHYTVDLGDVALFAMDTQAITWDAAGLATQQSYFDTAINSSTATWKLAFGHHPYKSNGDHGNAGEFDGRPPTNVRASGRRLRDFVDGSLCGAVDVYFSGHDHDRQWLEPVCGLELVVSGAGARTRTLPGVNPTSFQSATLGFMHVVIDGNTLTGTFYDATGTADFQKVLTKP